MSIQPKQFCNGISCVDCEAVQFSQPHFIFGWLSCDMSGHDCFVVSGFQVFFCLLIRVFSCMLDIYYDWYLGLSAITDFHLILVNCCCG